MRLVTCSVVGVRIDYPIVHAHLNLLGISSDSETQVSIRSYTNRRFG